MRIISGTKRGMKLLGPKTRLSRPITDRVKESLFSVLYKYDLPEGKRIADLFCGVGSLGLEALSRSAEFVTFVEQDAKIIAVLKKNVEKSGFTDKSKIIKADAFKLGAPVVYIEQGMSNTQYAIRNTQYDLIFVDPPYVTTRQAGEDSALSALLNLLAEQLLPDGIVVVRTSRRTELLEQYGRLQIIEQRQWGTMTVDILQQKSK